MSNVLQIQRGTRPKLRGLVFGKFYPFHIGHERLIHFARERCNELIVLVCASDREHLSGRTRMDWIRKTYQNDSHIRVIEFTYSENDLPNSSVSSRSISRIWAEFFLKQIDPVDIVFTAEDYGDYVAEYMNITHQRYPAVKEISATQIRDDITAHWNKINRHARPGLTKKVVLLGTESTGKTTLANYLSRTFSAGLVSEMGRELIATTTKCSKSDLVRVARLHAKSIKAKLETAGRILIIDTDIHITQSYGHYLFNTELPIDAEIKAINQADLYLYLDKDAPYVQDGTRLPRAERDALDTFHKNHLSQSKVPYFLLSGSFEEKYRLASKLVSQLLPSGL